MVDDVSRRLTTSGSLENRRRTGALTAENRHDTRVTTRLHRWTRADARSSLSRRERLPDAPRRRSRRAPARNSARGGPHRRVSAPNAKRRQHRETRREGRDALRDPIGGRETLVGSGCAGASTRADARKHASTRRPGAILRAAERLVLAAAVEDAAVSDAIENDGSLDQPPGGSDDTRIEEQVMAAFREPDVFDALFLREKEKETDGETNPPWWSRTVPVDLPGGESVVDLDLACLSNVSKEDETFDGRVAPPPSADTRNEEEARPDASEEKKKKEKSRRARLLGDERRYERSFDAPRRGSLRAFARLPRRRGRRKGRAARCARKAHQPFKKSYKRRRPRVGGVTGRRRRPVAGGGGAGDARADARAIQARAALDARRRAYHARCDAPDSGGSPLNPARGTQRAGTAKPSSATPPCEPGSALVKFNAQSRRDAASARLPGGALRPPVPLGRAARAPGARVGHVARAGGELVHQRARAHLAADDPEARRANRGRAAGGSPRGRERRPSERFADVKKTNAVSKWNARSGDRTMA